MKINTQIVDTTIFSMCGTTESDRPGVLCAFNISHKVTVKDKIVYYVTNHDRYLTESDFRAQHSRLVRQLRLGLQFSLDYDLPEVYDFGNLFNGRHTFDEITAHLEQAARAGLAVDSGEFIRGASRYDYDEDQRNRVMNACYRGFDTTPSVEASAGYKAILQWVRVR